MAPAATQARTQPPAVLEAQVRAPLEAKRVRALLAVRLAAAPSRTVATATAGPRAQPLLQEQAAAPPRAAAESAAPRVAEAQATKIPLGCVCRAEWRSS